MGWKGAHYKKRGILNEYFTGHQTDLGDICDLGHLVHVGYFRIVTVCFMSLADQPCDWSVCSIVGGGQQNQRRSLILLHPLRPLHLTIPTTS